MPDKARVAGWSGWAWAVPAATTLALLTFHLDRRQPWRDEIATWSAASRPVTSIFRLLGNVDAVLGPYYLFMHGWIRLFGDSPVALRTPSVLAMAASAGLIGMLGQRLFDSRAGLTAGLIFALLPATSRYGQEARPYAFTTLAAVCATIVFFSLLRRPTIMLSVAYSLSIVVLGLAQLTAVLLIAGHAVAGLRLRRLTLRWAIGAGAGLAALLPLAVLGRAQQARQVGWLDAPTWSSLREMPNDVVLSAVVAGLLLALALVGAGLRSTSEDNGRAVALVAIGVVPALSLLITGTITALYLPRYLTFTLPFLCLAAGWAVASLRTAAGVTAIVLVGLLGWPDHTRVRDNHIAIGGRTIDYAAAADVLRREAKAGDGVVYAERRHHAMLDLAMSYHLRDAAPADVLRVATPSEAGGYWADECPHPVDCLRGTDRIWILGNGTDVDPLATMAKDKAAALRAGFSIIRVAVVNGVTIDLATRRR